jgi:ankyrin repeat protein
MKFKVVPTLLSVLMTLGLAASCGKKAVDNNPSNNEKYTDTTETALIEETHKELYEAILVNDVNRVRQLLENKLQVDLNKILENGETLMTTAVAKDLYPIVEMLLTNNASVVKANSKKETPLMVASRLGYEELVRLLISLGAKTDNKDSNGNTALHLAILNKHEDIAIFLINGRTNIDITNNDNQNPLKLAEILQVKKVINLLRSLTQSSVGLPNKIDVRNLVSLGDLESLNQLFIKYPAVTYEYRDLNFYVLVMTSHPHDKALSMTHLLMGFGASLNGAAGSDITPLIEATKRDYEDFVILMLKENVNPNIVDDKGNTALIWAIRRNNQPIVKLLLDKHSAVKYTYYENGKRKTMKACDEAREMTRLSTTTEAIETNLEIRDLLGCGFWPF